MMATRAHVRGREKVMGFLKGFVDKLFGGDIEKMPDEEFAEKVAERSVLFFVQICVDIHFAYIMHKVKVKIVHTTLFQLTRKDLLGFAHILKVISGELGRQIETVSVVT